MREVFSKFTWPRAKKGYRWVKAVPFRNPSKRHPGLYLTDSVLYPYELEQERYLPLQGSDPVGLFRRFADIDTGQDKKGVLIESIDPSCQQKNTIVAFANSYGGLTQGEMIRTRDNLTGKETVVMGEPRVFWEQEIETMQRVLKLWDTLKMAPWGLSDVIQWKSDEVVFYNPDGKPKKKWDNAMASWEPILSFGHIPFLKKGDTEGAAWCYLMAMINKHLSSAVFPHLELEGSSLTKRPFQVGLHFTPLTLLGAMWLQFAQAVTQGEFSKCLYCDTPFAVSPGASRSNRRYCKDGCRVMHCRKRQQAKRKVLS